MTDTKPEVQRIDMAVGAHVQLSQTSPLTEDEELRLWALRIATSDRVIIRAKDEQPIHEAILEGAQAYYGWLTGQDKEAS